MRHWVWLILLGACGDAGQSKEPQMMTDAKDAGVAADARILVMDLVPVARVLDGDTFEVGATTALSPDGRSLSGEHIRLLGVDAPEVAHPPATADCFGNEAHQDLRLQIEGLSVELEFDEAHPVRDQFQRLLAYVHNGAEIVNERLIQTGQARSFPAVHRYRAHYDALEREARNAGRGLWTSCRR